MGSPWVGASSDSEGICSDSLAGGADLLNFAMDSPGSKNGAGVFMLLSLIDRDEGLRVV